MKILILIGSMILAFFAGSQVTNANFAEGVGGWQDAIKNLQDQIDNISRPTHLDVSERDTRSIEIPGTNISTLILSCNENESAVGVSFEPTLPNTLPRVSILKSIPTTINQNSGWEVIFENNLVTAAQIDVSVLCAKLSQ